MMPVGLLAAFCVAMSLLAVAKLALTERRRPVDVGATLLVVAITAFVLLWRELEGGVRLSPRVAFWFLAGSSCAAVGAGLLLRE